MKDVIHQYKTAKQIQEIVEDTGHPLHDQVLRAMSVETYMQLNELVMHLEDHGIDILAKEVN